MEGIPLGVGNEQVPCCRATMPRDLRELVYKLTHVQQYVRPVMLPTQAIFSKTIECLPLFVSGFGYISQRLPLHRLNMPAVYFSRNPNKNSTNVSPRVLLFRNAHQSSRASALTLLEWLGDEAAEGRGENVVDVEVLWTPADHDDSLDRDDLDAKWPELRAL